MSTNDQQKAELRRLFAKRLPGKLRQVAGIIVKLKTDKTDVLRRQLILHIDTSVRSCENFGFNAASELLHQIGQAAESGAVDVLAELNGRLHELANSWDEKPPVTIEAAETATAPIADATETQSEQRTPVSQPPAAAVATAEPSAPETAAESPEAILGLSLHPLLLALRDDEDRSEITRALALFGFAAQAHLQEQTPVAAIIALEKLESMQTMMPAGTPIIVIADEDSIAVRVQALRLGSHALLTRPVEASAIVQTLEHVAPGVSSEPPRVLIVDDSRSQSFYYNKVLTQAGCITKVVNAPLNIEGALQDLQPELILLDMQMPDCSGLELARVLKQMPAWSMTPVVFLSAEENEAKQNAAMAISGDDFLVKPVEAEALKLAVLKRISRSRAQQQWLTRDGLTGIPNRGALMQELEVQCSLAGRTNEPFTYVHLDVDRMAAYNGHHSHAQGDKLLQQLARLLRHRLRRSDGLGRTSGDAFGIILRNCRGQDAMRLFDSINHDFAALSSGSSFSTGMVTYAGNGPMAVRDAAAESLKKAKQHGGNQNYLAG